MAGAAAALVADKLGLSDKTVAAVTNAIVGATPEQLAQLKSIDAELTKTLGEQDVKREEVAGADRASAREREKGTGDSLTPRLLALFITVGFFGVLGFLLVHGKPTDGGDALLVMLGSLGTAWTATVSYYFGSTARSAEKTALLARK